MPPVKDAAVKAPKTASDFVAPEPRESPYSFPANATKVSCGKGSLVRGTRKARKDNEKPKRMLLYVSGDSVSPASTLAQIGRAIEAGLITREEITYLWSLADAASK